MVGFGQTPWAFLFFSSDQETNVLLPSCNYMSVPANFKPIVCFSALLLLDAAHMGRAEKGELQPASRELSFICRSRRHHRHGRSVLVSLPSVFTLSVA